MSEFHDQIAQYRAAIEAFLQAQFCQDLPQKRLFDAMRYSLLAGGKRIRPVLTLEFCRICGGDWQSAIPAGDVSPITRFSARRWLSSQETVF